jgi:uncharacterized phage protein (TIGR02218 family)
MSKTLAAGLQDHLDSGTTTMCYCWRITRKDAVVQGFTEHDEDLTFDGTVFEAEAGFTSSMVQQALGLSVDNMEVVSALDSAHISETDLIAGVYDDAGVEVFWVNWRDPLQRIVVMSGNLGEVTQKGIQFTAELRSLTHRLNQKIGRVYQRTCDAVFGDTRCGLDAAAFTSTGVVSAISSQGAFQATGLAQDADYYSRGVLTWLTGNNTNANVDVRVHTKTGDVSGFDLWTPAVDTVQVGDTFEVIAGCKQTLEICRDKFNNVANFQGFPHMPGKDIITIYAEQGGENQDGDALVF